MNKSAKCQAIPPTGIRKKGKHCRKCKIVERWFFGKISWSLWIFYAKARCDILEHEKSASIFFDTLYDDRN